MTTSGSSLRILILFAHPALEKSRVNRVLAYAVRDMDGVTFHDLYEQYPEFDIDVKHEKELCSTHDILIFQHPLFWYSTPAILKEWQDLVLEHGWAYGHDGNALEGKLFLNVISSGGKEEAYQVNGYSRHTVRQFLAPIEQTAKLCGMRFLPPFIVHGTHSMTPDQIDAHAVDYRRLLEALRDDRIDLSQTRDTLRINANLEAIIEKG